MMGGPFRGVRAGLSAILLAPPTGHAAVGCRCDPCRWPGREFRRPRDGTFDAFGNCVVARARVLLASREERRSADDAQRHLLWYARTDSVYFRVGYNFSMTETKLTDEDKIVFFKTMHGDISLIEFEKWVYENKDLEKIIPAESYFGLIEMNYRKSGAKYDLFRKLESIVSLGEYQRWKLNIILDKALLKDDSFPRLMIEFYDLYCDGYHFLNDLGLGYGLMFAVPPSKYKVDSWDELTSDQKAELSNGLFPEIGNEILKVKDWIDRGKIVLTGKKNELDRHDFKDLRTDEEKKSGVWIPVATESKKWWKFWA
ncbi:MAG TPA: hypothetical protein VL728_18020 [Cyclobacteriaceae bacterium]|jgi:hypothetical protein|nr:hypothetical protein [Cyclobacteriaceae bacterium]